MEPSDALIAACRASLARISARAAEFMVEHEDFSVRQCLTMAQMEEVILYGVPGDQSEPIGILGVSLLQSLKEKLKGDDA